MSRVIVLGTGTGVGKSHVTRALARALAELCPEAAVGALKPIETGLGPQGSSGLARAEDAESLSELFQHARPPAPHPLYGYAEPLTPYLAARREALPEPDLDKIRHWLGSWENETRRVLESVSRSPVLWTLIESAGGVFSPLAAGGSSPITNFELWQVLEPCVGILVGRDGLGTLHEVTATLSALRARGRLPDHLVLSAAGVEDSSRGSNAEVLEALGIARPSAVLGLNGSDLSALARHLLEADFGPRSHGGS